MNNTNETNQYKYAAFISYRHIELDKYVAVKIHKYLEEFKLPKAIRKKEGLKRKKIDRVFMDKEELTISNSLEDNIIDALKNSEYLIVICSPRTKESVWCCKEIEKFIEFHGRSKILTVLIEGEPSESFPNELLIDEKVVSENGITTIHRRDVEPLAADVRAESRGKIRKLLKTELLRIIAPMFGLEYSDLRQRHRERKIRRIISATVTAAILGAAVGVAGITSALIIKEQNDKILEQNDRIWNQSVQIEMQNEVLLNNQADSLATDALQFLEKDRVGDALNIAISSVTEYNGIKMPYTPNGRYALTMALRAYDAGMIYKAKYQFATKANIANVKVSNSGTYLFVNDQSNNAYIWDNKTGKLIYLIEGFDVDDKLEFVGDSKIIYGDENGGVKLIDYISGEETVIYENAGYINGFSVDKEGKYIAIIRSGVIGIYNVESKKIIHNINIDGDMDVDGDIKLAQNKVIYVLQNEYTEEFAEYTESSINIFDISSGESVSIDGTFGSLVNANSRDDMIYVAISDLDEENIGYGEIIAIDGTTNQIIWQNRYKGIFVGDMYIGKINDEPKIFTSTYSTLYCIDGYTGESQLCQDITEGIQDFDVASNGVISILSSEGRLFYYYFFTSELRILDYLIECNVDKISYGYICSDGYIIVPYIDNYIVKYEMYANEYRELYEASDEEMEKILESSYKEDQYDKIAEQMGLPNPSLVQYISYVEGENIALITYYDMSLVVYDMTNKNIIKTINDIGCEILRDYGRDTEGNLYVSGEGYGYCFDKDYNMLAEIESMMYVDIGEGYILVGKEEEIWKYPIYSFEQLKEMALKVSESGR